MTEKDQFLLCGWTWRLGLRFRLKSHVRPTRKLVVVRRVHRSGDALPRNPITGISCCCALTESSHATVALPTNAMKSRRLIGPSSSIVDRTGSVRQSIGDPAAHRYLVRSMSALGQKQTSRDVGSMSALPPKADIRRTSWNVRFVPTTDEVQRLATMYIPPAP
jgi:hypothetical protein